MIAEQKSSIEIVREHLDQPELLVQLAEEATELAQAALKLRRAYTGVNPTPITAKDAYHCLLEELADVSNCIAALGFDRGIDRMEVYRIASAKIDRWAERLESVPVADVAPVVHGEWIPKVVIARVPQRTRFRCSVCHFEVAEMTDYCPGCGARMDGDG